MGHVDQQVDLLTNYVNLLTNRLFSWQIKILDQWAGTHPHRIAYCNQSDHRRGAMAEPVIGPVWFAGLSPNSKD